MQIKHNEPWKLARLFHIRENMSVDEIRRNLGHRNSGFAKNYIERWIATPLPGEDLDPMQRAEIMFKGGASFPTIASATGLSRRMLQYTFGNNPSDTRERRKAQKNRYYESLQRIRDEVDAALPKDLRRKRRVMKNRA